MRQCYVSKTSSRGFSVHPFCSFVPSVLFVFYWVHIFGFLRLGEHQVVFFHGARSHPPFAEQTTGLGLFAFTVWLWVVLRKSTFKVKLFPVFYNPILHLIGGPVWFTSCLKPSAVALLSSCHVFCGQFSSQPDMPVISKDQRGSWCKPCHPSTLGRQRDKHYFTVKKIPLINEKEIQSQTSIMLLNLQKTRECKSQWTLLFLCCIGSEDSLCYSLHLCDCLYLYHARVCSPAWSDLSVRQPITVCTVETAQCSQTKVGAHSDDFTVDV